MAHEDTLCCLPAGKEVRQQQQISVAMTDSRFPDAKSIWYFPTFLYPASKPLLLLLLNIVVIGQELVDRTFSCTWQG